MPKKSKISRRDFLTTSTRSGTALAALTRFGVIGSKAQGNEEAELHAGPQEAFGVYSVDRWKGFGDPSWGRWTIDAHGLPAFELNFENIPPKNLPAKMALAGITGNFLDWCEKFRHLLGNYVWKYRWNPAMGGDLRTTLPDGFRRVNRQDQGGWIYVKDGSSGSAGAGWPAAIRFLAGNSDASFKAQLGIGYGRQVIQYRELEIEYKVYVPPGEHPAVVINDITIKNRRRTKAQLDVYALGESLIEKVGARFDNETGVVACGRYFFSLDPQTARRITGAELTRSAFVGGGDLARPEALERKDLQGVAIPEAEDLLPMVRFEISLSPGESYRFATFFGMPTAHENTKSPLAAALETREQLGTDLSKTFSELVSTYRRMISGIEFKLPDEWSWLERETAWNLYYARVNCFLDMRLGSPMNVHGTSYLWEHKPWRAFTRDDLQEATCNLFVDPAMARSNILAHLRFQHSNGFMPFEYDLERHQPFDKPECDQELYLIWYVTLYLEFTRDLSFLDQKVPFWEGEQATVYEHLRRAVHFTLREIGLGPSGLINVANSDWSDALDLGGVGESVLASEQAVFAWRRLREISLEKGDQEFADFIEAQEGALRTSVIKMYNGRYISRAVTRSGRMVGDWRTDGRVFTHVQTWGVIAGLLDAARSLKCMDAVRTTNDTAVGPSVVQPPYDEYDPELGRISAPSSIPGYNENGGIWAQCAIWAIWAESLLGRSEAAWHYLLENSLAHHAMRWPDFPFAVLSYPDAYKAPPALPRDDNWDTSYNPDRTSEAYLENSRFHCVPHGMYPFTVAYYLMGIQPKSRNHLTLRPVVPQAWTRWAVRVGREGHEISYVAVRTEDGLEISITLGASFAPQQTNLDFPLLGAAKVRVARLDGKIHREWTIQEGPNRRSLCATFLLTPGRHRFVGD